MKEYRLIEKGNIRLGDKVMISDPCYGLDTWCQGVLKNVLPGEYKCFVEYSDEGEWGTRVSAIEVRHQDYAERELDLIDPEDFEVGVDSGQAGIFDYDYYIKYHTDSKERDHVDDEWYDKVCDKTHECIANPKYTPFVNTVEYKGMLLAFRQELDELADKYPELDVNSGYIKLINDYNDLDDRKSWTNLSDLIQALQDINDILSKNDNPDEVANAIKEIAEKIESQTELNEINHKYEINMHKLWVAYMDSSISRKKDYILTGNTIDDLGFVSSSGYGDGSYTCWTQKNDDGKIIGIRVEFISEYDEED